MKIGSGSLWVLSFVLVAAAAIYQRVTGPTYPVRGKAHVGALEVRFSLPTSSSAEGNEEVRLAAPDAAVRGTIELRRFPSNDPWTRSALLRQGEFLIAYIPHQPPAGKVLYRIYLDRGADLTPLTQDPVVLRFKGDVPLAIMVPHIFLMFLAMLFSTRSGFEAILKRPELRRLSLWTVVTLGIGGMILGPVVQKFAFGAFWTGWPFGGDLTDNKTILAFLFWAIALWRLHKQRDARGWAIAASVILFLVYMIPHSLLGSQLDYSQPAVQGK